jgi:prevent-host-death family protein
MLVHVSACRLRPLVVVDSLGSRPGRTGRARECTRRNSVWSHLHFWPIWPTVRSICIFLGWMKTLTAKDAKYGFGRLIDLARLEPVRVAKHGRPVVVVMAVEEFERLQILDRSALDKAKQGTRLKRLKK